MSIVSSLVLYVPDPKVLETIIEREQSGQPRENILDPADLMKPGSLIANRYEIVSRIGKGGMGTVYKVMDLKVNRIMAVKLLSSEHLTDPTHIERFKREAMAAATLSHPHLAGVYDYGLSSDGSPFLVMEFLSGEPISDTIDRCGYLSVDSTNRIASQIANGLAYAHSQNIVHRDLKPSNIILLDQAADEFIKVVDFGIIKFITPESQEASRLTGTGEVFGSPLYMSPEQCHGSQLDGRTDIYSLGCMMYEMLTGNPPFRGQSPVQTICMHLQNEPDAFSKVRPDLKIPQELERIVFRCLEKNADSRFQTMGELIQSLRAVKSDAHSAIGGVTQRVPRRDESEEDSGASSKVNVSTANHDSRTKPSSAVNRPESGRLADDTTAGARGRVARPNIESKFPLLVIGMIVFAILGGGLFAAFTFFKTPQMPNASLPTWQSASNLPQTLPTNVIGLSEEDLLERAHPMLTVTNASVPGKPDVEMISVYMGKGKPPSVTVDVKRQGSCILVLNAYQTVIWNLKISPASKVEKIILSGYNYQQLNGGEGIPVISSFYQDAHQKRLSKQPFEMATGSLLHNNNQDFHNSNEYANFNKMVNAACGRSITRIQAEYLHGSFEIK